MTHYALSNSLLISTSICTRAKHIPQELIFDIPLSENPASIRNPRWLPSCSCRIIHIHSQHPVPIYWVRSTFHVSWHITHYPTHHWYPLLSAQERNSSIPFPQPARCPTVPVARRQLIFDIATDIRYRNWYSISQLIFDTAIDIRYRNWYSIPQLIFDITTDIRYPNWLQLMFDIHFHLHKSETPAEFDIPPLSSKPQLISDIPPHSHSSETPAGIQYPPPTLIFTRAKGAFLICRTACGGSRCPDEFCPTRCFVCCVVLHRVCIDAGVNREIGANIEG